MSDLPTMTAEELGLEPELEIEIAPETAPEEPKREIKPEEGIEELRAKLLSEQKAREQLEEQAARATSAAQNAYVEKEESDIALVQSAIQHVQGEQKRIKAELSAALKSGDTDLAADLMLEAQTVSSNRQQLEQGLEALKERNAQMRRAPPPQQAPQREADPVEAVARNLTPASAKWVRAHPEFATDESKTKKMVAAHYAAISENLTADTPEYFDFVEQQLGITNEPPPSRPAQREAAPRPQPPAAPARGNSGAGNKRVVTLSAAEREVAKMNGMTDEEYARNKIDLIKEGKIGTTH